MKKFLLILLITLLCVSAYFLYDNIKIEPEVIDIIQTEKNDTDKPNDEIEIINKDESIEKRYSRLPYEYPEFPKSDVPEKFKLEVHTKFVDWIDNNNPPVKNDEFATWEEGILPKINGKISFYKTRSTPANINMANGVKIPKNWQLSTDEKKPCV